MRRGARIGDGAASPTAPVIVSPNSSLVGIRERRPQVMAYEFGRSAPPGSIAAHDQERRAARRVPARRGSELEITIHRYASPSKVNVSVARYRMSGAGVGLRRFDPSAAGGSRGANFFLRVIADDEDAAEKRYWILPTDVGGRAMGAELLVGCRTMHGRGVPLSLGQKVRVGGVTLKVVAMRAGGGDLGTPQTAQYARIRRGGGAEGGSGEAPDGSGASSGALPAVDEGAVCYICYDGSHSADNPLLSPCACKGSMKYCHALCLSRWCDEQVEAASPHVTRVSSRTQRCCVCRAEYQKEPVGAQDQGFVAHEILKEIRGPYIVLERSTRSGSSASETFVLACNGVDGQRPKSKFVIGRPADEGNKVDVPITSASVSCSHAIIERTASGFCVSDLGTLGGTAVSITRPLMISPSQPTHLVYKDWAVRILHRRSVRTVLRDALHALRPRWMLCSGARLDASAGDDGLSAGAVAAPA